ncbi:ABC transporter ATP-binding protein [Paenibacillus sp. SC116]|uniref:ATP-binding cassette domain-containing protein n=1 Tax=Paenibacillus sp. SC116 TaxID=2968986 RepID=UPI00215A9A95|nr:ABC transporter ATP-binding protein [Paenibacillus sp. SC116]MCR8844339.1 ABC transporter ATP-binding protein [Paenibacillus sp. SC116]
MLRIKADKVSLQYQNKAVLKNVSFELEGEKIYGLLGRNGAGKTSLLSILAAFVKQTNGSITVDGEPVFENAKVMEQIVFIRDVKLDDESGRVNKYIKDLSIFRPNFDLDYAERLIKRFKIPTDTEISKLSRGMQSAFHAIIGLASRCPITIFDEAYLGMDAPAREIFYEEVLNDFMEHPRTIILSTHLISEMESMFEEVLIIDQGEMILHEEAETLRESGVSVTGAVEAVDHFVHGKHILKEQVLGGTKLVMIYGQLSEKEREEAKAMQLTLGPITLQELFIHLTKEDKQ